MIINIGQFNKMKVVREADFGYYLDRGTRYINSNWKFRWKRNQGWR